MRIKDNTVIFEKSDMAFVQKFGVMEATETVLDYKSVCPLPFLYDSYQLSHFLGVGRKDLFDLIKNGEKAYHPVTLEKKNGKQRRVYSPDDKLKKCQNRILRDILSKLPVSQYATAYKKGSTLIRNASPHVGKRYLLKMDIADFFGSIHFEQIYSAAFHTRYFPKQIGVLLTTLCCRKSFLPQGAPTSPALSNLVMRNFDDAIGQWCEQRGISYTRYCDDMTFSSDQPLFAVYTKVKTMLEEMGFELNEKKTYFVSNAGRQSVTGLTVNEKVSVSGDYKRRLRQEIYYTLKFGLSEHIIRSGKTEFLTDGLPNTEKYYTHLLGQIDFVLQIEPGNTWFQNARNQMQSNCLKREK